MRINSVQKIVLALKKGICTKNGIMEDTNLSWGSCSSLINLLCEKEIVVMTDKKIGLGKGRRTTEFRLNRNKNLLFGMEIREDEIQCSIMNWGEEEIFRIAYPNQLPVNHTSLIRYISAAYINSLVEAGIKQDAVIGLSIALAGGVDVAAKKWLFSPRIKAVNNFNFNQLFKVLPEISFTFIEHDIHAQASSVIKLHNWTDSNYVFLHIGNGISMSIYQNGLFFGGRGFAGEIGHIPYCTNGKNAQTVESAVSAKGIIGFINEHYGLNINSIAELPPSIQTDRYLFEYVYHAVKYLLIVITNVLDPNTIMMGGSVMEPFFPLLKEKIELNIRSVTWAGGPQNIRWYNHAEMYGAYGTILNASHSIINSVLEKELV